MTVPDDTIFVLTGCTAVGKTHLALEWAAARNAEIVSCDSLLFYRGMDIGTAKPTRAERNRIPHHLVDICDPSKGMDIGAYLDRAIEVIDAIRRRGKRALVTGGSGFYLKAFFEPVVDSVVVSAETRERVRAIEAEGGLDGLLAALVECDPDCADVLDTQNPRRVVKALERCLETGQSLKTMKSAFASQTNALIEAPKRLTVLERDKDSLNERIERRVDAMLEDGLIEEVKRLREAGFESNASAAASIGYRECLQFLDGELDREAMRERIIVNTRRLAKKQRTWFRTQLPESNRVTLGNGATPVIEELFK